MTYIPKARQEGLYYPEFEHDACGVGVVANIKGVRSHQIILDGIEVLNNLAHRGASGSDPETGDGAGILVQIPHAFMRKVSSNNGFSLPEQGEYAVGNIFFPQDELESERYRLVIEKAIQDEGQRLLGWREVPVNSDAIGVVAKLTQPRIQQVFIGSNSGATNPDEFERSLYVLRKVIEQCIEALNLPHQDEFYICTLSSNKIVYKGLLMGYQLSGFYQDLSDPEFVSSFALVHSRFSTNTLGSWKLAHPYRFLVHNGEINTLRGNINWMLARQGRMESSLFGDNLPKLFPIITPGASDTAAIDNAVELLLATGRPIHHVMMMLVPEATGVNVEMPQVKRDFYDFHSCLMEPWDGPALIAFTDGNRIGAVLDRNGLRPFRYLVTKNDLLVMASEVGVLEIPPEEILFKDRIQPGRMFLVDPERGGIVTDQTLKEELSNAKPYGRWLHDQMIKLEDLPHSNQDDYLTVDNLLELQRVFGYTREDIQILMGPMADTGSEPIGSMGNDAPLAVLSDHPQLMYNYFKQLFAQVTNPPLDAIREELVTSLQVTLGSEQNLFDETPEHARQLKLASPILTTRELSQIKHLNQPGLKVTTLKAHFNANGKDGELENGINHLCAKASDAIASGYTILILSDRGVDRNSAPIPSLLAMAAVHHHLIREGTRTKVGLISESGEPREVAHFALLIGYGAGAINPYLAYATLADLRQIETENKPEIVESNYTKAINKGLLKIISKMGISTIASYRGAQIFEAIGLGETVIDKYFTWTPSRIGGVSLEAIEQDALHLHKQGFGSVPTPDQSDLDIGGVYYWRRDGEYHMWNPNSVALLQHAARMNDTGAYSRFADLANNYETKLCTLRGLLDFKWSQNPLPLDQVESADQIAKRLASGAISLGAISKEAHETLAIAMNRIGARSNSGEGGEDYRRYTPDSNGDRRFSAIKQVASGRFGVTTNYLVNATDLQIKMAQGSKPGEGGQLPGRKVDDYIGWVRHSTPGVELISPPPHHDIYSIEDLAQLIFDLKNANSEARIHVKLVSEIGVGTIAAGVSKAHADVVLISGDSGGTGASPESSVKHAGLPWELGIAETQQVLVRNDLRGRIVVQADGQIKTGRDVAIACLLGAEEFGIATGALVTLGCIMLRKCHLNTCSVGIATQDPELRKRFAGKPEYVINYFYFVAEELRGIMAKLGIHSIDEMVGRTDLLETKSAIDHWKTKGIDLSNLLYRPDVPDSVATHHVGKQSHGLESVMDQSLINEARSALDKQAVVVINKQINNSDRTVGAMLSGEVAKQYGEEGLPDNTIQCQFTGSAGQSFAAFLARGISFYLEGDSNDYFGKGMSGGRLVVVPPKTSTFIPEDNIIVGNVSLYGATGGEVFLRGKAGERFCVRNSGANAVVEGIGDHGCEYMTNGRVVVLGATGRNFAAGMSGGIAYIYDKDSNFESRCNLEMVDLEPVETLEDKTELYELIKKHQLQTQSSVAAQILNNWTSEVNEFVKVYPKDYRRVIEGLSKIEVGSND